MASNGQTVVNGNANDKAGLSQVPALDCSDDQISGIPPYPPLDINDATANRNDHAREDTVAMNMEAQSIDNNNYWPPRSPSATNSSNHNPNYMSEPSLSEDGTAASSSHYTGTHTSPLNQAIHMNDSPSNTSLSSLGSPGATRTTSIVRKKMNFGQLAPMGNLLSPIAASSDLDSNGDVSFNLKGIENSTGGYSYQQLKDDNDILQKVDFDLKYDDHDERLNGKALKPRHTLQESQDITPESQRYFSAQEESEMHEEEDGNSSGLYDSSSQEGQAQSQGKQKQSNYSKLQTPPSTGNAAIKPGSQQSNRDSDPKDADKEFLLKNTDFGIMDLSSNTNTASPEKRRTTNIFKISTPPKMTSFQSLEEEEITPKRRTSGPPSVNDSSPSSTSSVSPSRTLVKSMSLPVGIKLVESNSSFVKPQRKLSDLKRHRRTRSGDDAAATLLTGSAEWAGMELHKFPLPKDRDADDDDHDDKHDLMSKHLTDQSSSWDQGVGRKGQRRKPKRNSHIFSDNETVRQAISADDVDLMMAMAKSPNALEEGISTRFSPRVAGMGGSDSPDANIDSDVFYPRVPALERNLSFGDVSASTAESSFSWISRGTATIAKEYDMNLTKGSLLPLSDNAATAMLTPPINNKPCATTGLLQPIAVACAVPSIDRDVEMQAEQRKKEDAFDAHMRELRNAPPSPTRAPKLEVDSSKEYPTFTCPRCKTIQREFFTVTSAPKRFESPAQYIVLYFFMYMIMSLFLFGMEVSQVCARCS